MPVLPGCWALAVLASLGHPLRQRAAMTPPSLPAELIAALDARLQGVSRHELATRAEKISKTYREGGRSMTITSATDALAYALVRMPATYAAVAACLNAVQEIMPDFAPPDRERQVLPRRTRFPRSETSPCSMPIPCCASSRSGFCATISACTH